MLGLILTKENIMKKITYEVKLEKSVKVILGTFTILGITSLTNYTDDPYGRNKPREFTPEWY